METSRRLSRLSEKLDGPASSIPPIAYLPPRYQKLAKTIAAILVGVALAAKIIAELF